MTTMYLGGKRKGKKPKSSKKYKKRTKGSKGKSKTKKNLNSKKQKSVKISRKPKNKTMKKSVTFNLEKKYNDPTSKLHSYEQKQLFIDNGSIKDFYYYEQHNDEPPIFLYKDLKNE